MSERRPFPAAVQMFALVVCFALPSRAVAGEWSGGLRVGTAQEASQGTVQSGFEFGAVVERSTGGAFDLGLGLGLALDGSQDYGPFVSILSFEGHLRTSTARRPVYLELGLGWYTLDVIEVMGPGGFVGAGYEWHASSEMRVALGAAYHFFASEVSATGGEMEDYYAIGVTLRW